MNKILKQLTIFTNKMINEQQLTWFMKEKICIKINTEYQFPDISCNILKF